MPFNTIQWYFYVCIKYEVVEWLFITFSQWQDIFNLPQPIQFIETNISDSPVKHIDEILHDWKDIHQNTQHTLTSF